MFLVSCAAEILWIKNLLEQLQVLCAFVPPQIFYVDIGVTYLSVNLVFHSL